MVLAAPHYLRCFVSGLASQPASGLVTYMPQNALKAQLGDRSCLAGVILHADHSSVLSEDRDDQTSLGKNEIKRRHITPSFIPSLSGSALQFHLHDKGKRQGQWQAL